MNSILYVLIVSKFQRNAMHHLTFILLENCQLIINISQSDSNKLKRQQNQLQFIYSCFLTLRLPTNYLYYSPFLLLSISKICEDIFKFQPLILCISVNPIPMESRAYILRFNIAHLCLLMLVSTLFPLCGKPCI